MDIKKYFTCVTKGVIAALIFTIISTAILSLVMMKFTISEGVFNASYTVISGIALVTGCILAAKAHENRGWLLGFGVAIIYYVLLYIIGISCGASATISFMILIKFALCVIIGVLAGMLGINI